MRTALTALLIALPLAAGAAEEPKYKVPTKNTLNTICELNEQGHRSIHKCRQIAYGIADNNLFFFLTVDKKTYWFESYDDANHGVVWTVHVGTGTYRTFKEDKAFDAQWDYVHMDEPSINGTEVFTFNGTTIKIMR